MYQMITDDTRSGHKFSDERWEEKKQNKKKKTLIIARAHFFFALEIAFDVEMLVGSHEKCWELFCICPQMKRTTDGRSGPAMETVLRHVVWELNRNHEPARLAAALPVPTSAGEATQSLSRALLIVSSTAYRC